jgi:hypothetical protein
VKSKVTVTGSAACAGPASGTMPALERTAAAQAVRVRENFMRGHPICWAPLPRSHGKSTAHPSQQNSNNDPAARPTEFDPRAEHLYLPRLTRSSFDVQTCSNSFAEIAEEGASRSLLGEHPQMLLPAAGMPLRDGDAAEYEVWCQLGSQHLGAPQRAVLPAYRVRQRPRRPTGHSLNHGRLAMIGARARHASQPPGRPPSGCSSP